MKKISDEDFLKKQGWKKVKGYRIDLEMLRDFPDDWDELFIEEFGEYLSECEYWTAGDERAYSDVDTLLTEVFEEFLDDKGDLYDEPVQVHKPEVSKSHNNQQNKQSEVSLNSSHD